MRRCVDLLGSATALLILGVAPGNSSAQEPVRVVTLAEAIDLAIANSPVSVAASGVTRTAELSEREALGAFLPTVNVGSSFATSSNERFDQTSGRLVSESYSAQATASVEVFSFGRRLANRAAAGARVDAAEANELDQEFSVALSTTQVFYDVAASTELLRVAEQRLERARSQLEFARVRLDLETVPRSDVLRAELEVGNAEIAVLEAEVARSTGALRLARQIGVSGEVLADVTALPDVAPALPALGDLVPVAESVSPPVRAAEADLRDWSAQKLSSYTQYAPSLRMSAGYDWFSFNFPPSDRSWNLRLTLSVPVFDGFAREGRVDRARTQERVARVRYDDAVRGARVAVEDAYRRIRSAEQRVGIAQRGIDLAREDLRVQEERYQLGVATIIDLQASQVALADAEIAWVTARQNLGLAVAQLEAVLGRSIEELDI